jgi:hypothetical protein
MVVVDRPAESQATFAAWGEGERRTVAAMGAINLATVALVDAIAYVLELGGWVGHGIESPEHWVTWKAGVAKYRATGLVAIAQRREELPACWALFREGRLTEDAMGRIARRVPAAYDDQVARLAPDYRISQLVRTLHSLPPLEPPQPEPNRQRYHRRCTRTDGWTQGEYCLPPDEAAMFDLGLDAARDAEYRDRHDLPEDTEVTDGQRRGIDLADALVRMATETTDALDAHLERTGVRGDRYQVVVHHHLDGDGRIGPGRLHLGAWLEGSTARFLACDAQVIAMAHQAGRLLGINATERTANRRMRRYLEQRDGGCVHPACQQRRNLHAHHLEHWEDGGATIPSNLVSLCRRHHRALHLGEWSISGDPEAGTLEFRDARGAPLDPPALGADPLPAPAPHQLTYRQPYGGRIRAVDFSWN